MSETNKNANFIIKLNELLDEWKKEKDKSLSQIADEIGIARQTLSQYRDGNTSPDIVTFTRIADYFNVSYEYLLDDNSYRNLNEEELLKDFKDSKDEIILIVRKLVELYNDLSMFYTQDKVYSYENQSFYIGDWEYKKRNSFYTLLNNELNAKIEAYKKLIHSIRNCNNFKCNYMFLLGFYEEYIEKQQNSDNSILVLEEMIGIFNNEYKR